MNATGTAAIPNGSGITTLGDDHLIGSTVVLGRNIISGNNGPGIMLFTGSDNVDIWGNYIGTNAAGTAAVGSQSYGIRVTGTVTGCTIGGDLPTYRNVISGNQNIGVSIESDTSGCVVQGNYIGTNAEGTASVGNGTGIDLHGSNTVVGGNTAGHRNVISGNAFQGIVMRGSSTAIRGNYIGLNAAGTAAIANASGGIRVIGATGGTIGGAVAGQGNVVSGNGADGIVFDSDTNGITVAGNLVGTDATGASAIANTGSGISVYGSGHLVGGSTAAARNIISGNQSQGVIMGGANNSVRGNYIGTNLSGSSAIANASGGIRAIGASSATIGGASAGQGNLVSGNTGNGIALDSDVSSTIIIGNLIGTNAGGTLGIANSGIGVSLDGTGNTLGGTTAAERNVISGNTQGGVGISGTGHEVIGNYIGLNAAGTGAIPNTSNGIRVFIATEIRIGGTGAGEGNIISGNAANGIELDDTSSNVEILGNRIGTNPAGTAALPNQGSGITVDGSDNVVGGNTAPARNLISGNVQQGITLGGTNNAVKGNYIGTNAAGTAALGNGSYGVRIYEATGGLLGGDTVAEGNLISGNERAVSLEVGSTGIAIYNNIIGLDITMTANLADNASGIQVDTSGNTIGAANKGNVIAGMNHSGITLGDGATGNIIRGNWLGTNKALDPDLGNNTAGIWINDAYDNTIGGAGAGQGNIIRYNGFIGIRSERGEFNEITGNSIDDNGLLGIDVGKQYVHPNDFQDADLIGNHGQNYPLLTTVTVGGGSTHIEGKLFNEPGTGYRIEFFSSPACDDTGFGEGRTYLGFTNKSTDANGHADFSTDIGLAVTDGFVSATVTDEAGNTSEFSPCAQVGGPNAGKIQFFRDLFLAYEGVTDTVEVILTRSHGVEGTVSVNLTSTDNTATAGQDYTNIDQVVTFQPLEVVKIVHLPILVSPPGAEGDPETLDLALSNPTGGATLGLSASEVLIFDENKSTPGITIDDASVTEGNSGTKQMTFNVHLSASNHPVTVEYFTEPGTASEGSDYVFKEDQISFGASDSPQTQQISITINGDTTPEDDEVVWVRVVGVSGGGDWVAFKTYGAGIIVNDDGVVTPPALFKDGFEDLD